MTNTKTIVAGVAGGLLVLLFSVFTGGEQVVPAQDNSQVFTFEDFAAFLGAQKARTTITNSWRFTESITEGGSVLSTSTVTALFGTTSIDTLSSYKTIVYTPNLLTATATIPAAPYFNSSLLGGVGDSMTWLLVNGTSTASRNVGIDAGAGVTINTLASAGTGFSTPTIPPNKTAQLTCVRISSSAIRCSVNIQN